MMSVCFFFFSSRRRHTRCGRDWSSDVCSSDLVNYLEPKGNLDINWENVVIMKLTDNINMRLLIHMIYDENVLFPVHDRSEERRVGKECRSRRLPYHKKKNNTQKLRCPSKTATS